MYRSLQAGRAAAACLVVLFHLGGTFAQDKYFGFKALDVPFSWGDAGVEYFFVLSGFLITVAHRADFGRPAAFGRYLTKRALRIYPTYWVVCLAVCLAALAVPTLRPALSNDLGSLLQALLLIPQDPAVVGGTGAPILFVAWSLQYEMLFYGIVGLTVLHRSLGLCAALGLLLLRASCELGNSCGFPGSFLSSNLIFLFAMGVAGAYLVQSRMKLPFALSLGTLGVVAFVGFGLFESVHGRETLSLDRRLVYGAIGTVIIVALARAEEDGSLRLRGRWIRTLGDSSYALYLLHIPVISLAVKLLMAAGISRPSVIVAAFVAVFVACVAVAVVFHRWLELPLLQLLRPLVERPERLRAATGTEVGQRRRVAGNSSDRPAGSDYRPGTPFGRSGARSSGRGR